MHIAHGTAVISESFLLGKFLQTWWQHLLGTDSNGLCKGLVHPFLHLGGVVVGPLWAQESEILPVVLQLENLPVVFRNAECEVVVYATVAAVYGCRLSLWLSLHKLWNAIGNGSFNVAFGGEQRDGNVYAVGACT